MSRGLLDNLDQPVLISQLHEEEYYNLKFTSKLKPLSTELIHQVKLNPLFDGLPLGIGFSLKLLEQEIIETKVLRGFFRQNLEQKLDALTPNQCLEKITALNFDEPLPYQIALKIAYEELFELDTTNEEANNRAYALEMCRIVHHLRILENIFSYIESIKGFNLVKLIQHKLSLYQFREAQSQLIELKYYYLECDIIQKRLTKLAIITQHLAASYGLTGLFLKANRINYEQRGKNNHRINYQTKPQACLKDHGDALNRTLIRIEECIASINWLIDKNFGELNISSKINLDTPPKKIYASSFIDGPEGELKISVFYYKNKIIHKIKTPSYFIAQCLPHFLHKRDLRELKLILISLGLSTSEIDK